MSEFKKCRVIMFPTSDITGIVLHPTGLDKIVHTEESALKAVWDDGGVSQHLYITSDENIEVGDYVLSKLYGIGKVVSDKWANYKGKTPMLVQFKNKAIMYGKDGSYKDDGNKMYLNDCYKIVATTDKSLLKDFRGYEYGTAREYSAKVYLPRIPQSFIKQYVEAGGIDEIDMFNEYIETDSGNYIILKPTKKSWTREEIEDMLFDISTELSWDDKDEDEKILNCQAKIKEIRESL